MRRETPQVRIVIGTAVWTARIRRDLAPRSCEVFEGLLPHRGEVLHARWSGEACWAPLAAVWPSGRGLPPERATSRPQPGQILLFGGERSEPELLLPYGICRFASRAGSLAGNPVLTIEGPLDGLVQIGREVLRGGTMELKIEMLPTNQASRYDAPSH